MPKYSLCSPDQKLCLQIALEDGALTYSVAKNQVTVIDPSPIGAVLSGVDLTCGLTAVSESKGCIDEQYTLPAFKKAVCLDNCNTLSIDLEKDGYPMTLEARAYNDAAAFRMVFREKEIMEKETTGFVFPEDTRSIYGMKFRFTYEDEFNLIPYEDLYQNLWIFPMLIEADHGVWALITEAAVYGNYAGSTLSSTEEQPGLMRVNAPLDEFTKQELPVETPWRVVLAGTLDEIVNSNTIENLNPPTRMKDLSFIKPGLAAWSCMTDGHNSNCSIVRQKEYVDFAARMGWAHVCVDHGWRESALNLRALIAYANKKGIGIWLQEHQRFFKNPIETNEIFDRWEKWGLAGVKIDFFESDTRERLAKYDWLAEIAAEHHLMVNFHGATKPAGNIRRWPHVLSYEGVMGGENFQNYATQYFVQPTARHNCTIAFTRNAVGPMDYTPTTYGTHRTGTTDAHQTALPVVFTSYIGHIMESPEVLEAHPCSEFLKGLPAAWDESILLEGQPTCHVTMARRKDTTWWIGGICAGRGRIATVDLSFLDEGEYQATLYQDGMDDLNAIDVPVGVLDPIPVEQYEEWESWVSRPTSHMHDLRLADISSFIVTKGQKLEIPCVQDGGFALKLEKK